MDTEQIAKLARLIRYFILTISTNAGSGHPTSSLSAVELTATLFFRHLRFDLKHPENPANDRVIFSKGHATPLLYSLYAAAGAVSQEELMTYRQYSSVLEGHPTFRFPFTEASTGSLGQGLAIGVGMALGQQKKFSTRQLPSSDYQLPYTYVLMEDGECAEGSVWEAAAGASQNNLGNLILILDVNRFGQSDETMYGHNLDVYVKRFAAFGWNTIVVDGHDISAIDEALSRLTQMKRVTKEPTVIIAKTLKGKGVSFLEDKNGWHGKPVSADELTVALKEFGTVDLSLRGKIEAPKQEVRSLPAQAGKKQNGTIENALSYKLGDMVATRKAYGTALVRIAESYPEMLVIDGDVKNSTYTEFFAKEYPERFLELYIAEQLMIGVATGLWRTGHAPWVSTFASFITRSADQIRMAGLSGVTIRINGSHAGVSIGQDGPSQMGLEDISFFRSVLGSTVLYPSDAVSCERLVECMMEQTGVSYIRTTRPEAPVLYDPDDLFRIGGSKVHQAQSKERATIVAAGITLHEALAAQKTLDADGLGARVLDCYSVKPIDGKSLLKAAQDTGNIIVVEDHFKAGGLGEAVLSALAPRDISFKFRHLAVEKTPRSAKPAELLSYEGISAGNIEQAIRELLE